MTNNTIPNVPRELKPCPFCGGKAHAIAENAAIRQPEVVMCLACLGEIEGAGAIDKWNARTLSAPSPAGVDGLGNTAKLLLPALRQYMHNDGSGLLAGYDLETTQAIIDGLRGEVADLHTTMMAAAVEIQEHWAAHCDEEGYGPANLMHRLERGIASQYGYRAETLVRLESQRDQHARRIGELEAALEFACKALAQVTSSDGSGHADIAVSVLRMAGTKDADALHVVEDYKAGAKWRIDAALAVVCAAAPNITPTSEHSGS